MLEIYSAKEAEFGGELIRELERVILLKVVDTKWMNHIDDMAELKKGIGLRAFGQKNPVVEYRYEGFEMFDAMVEAIREDTVRMLLTVRIQKNSPPQRCLLYTSTERQTARREVFEETGIDIEINEETRQEYTYKTLNGSIKKCIYFCNEFDMQEIKIQQEEISESWLLPYEEAMKLLNFKEDGRILEKADGTYD